MSEQHPTTSIEQRARDLFSGYVEEVAHIPTWETEEETTDVQALREAPHNGYGEPTLSDRQLIATATKLLDGSLLARPTLERRDDWGSTAGRSLDAMSAPEVDLWIEVLRHAETPRSKPPPSAWLATARERIAALGEDRFRDLVEEWLGLLSLPPSHKTYRDDSAKIVATGFIAKSNALVLRGLPRPGPRYLAAAPREGFRIACHANIAEAVCREARSLRATSEVPVRRPAHLCSRQPGSRGFRQPNEAPRTKRRE